MFANAPSPAPTEDASAFATTHWSMVRDAGRDGSPKGQAALEALCRAYLRPVYVYMRRRGVESHDAQDLTQAFFARLLEKHFLDEADRTKGKFRSFLLAGLEHFLANQWRDACAQKRGGGRALLSLDADAERQWGLELADALDPAKMFDRGWALTLLEQTMDRLREECAAAGKARLFECLKGVLSGEKGEVRYSVMGGRLGMTEGAIKVAVHRLRRRYGELLRQEIAQTVNSPDEIDEEIQHLFAALS